MDRLAAALSRLSVARPRGVLLLLALVTLACAPGLGRLRLRLDGHTLVPAADPAVVFDGWLRERFGLRDPVVVAIEADHPDGIYNPATPALVKTLSAALAAVPGLGRDQVMSLATEHRDRVFPGTLDFRTFLEPLPTTPEQLAELRDDIAAAGILTGTLVAFDGRATAIVVGAPPFHDFASDGTRDRAALYRDVRRVVEQHASAMHRIDVVGAPIAEAILGDHVVEDLARLVPLAMAVVAGVVWVVSGRLAFVALAMLEIATTLVFTFGTMGWIGDPIYLPTAVLPVILVTMALTDDIHVVWAYQQRLRAATGQPRPALVVAVMRDTARPVVLTAITTSVGFLSFGSASLTPIGRFGVYAAMGVAFAMLYTLTVTPALLAVLPAAWLRPRERGVGRAFRELVESHVVPAALGDGSLRRLAVVTAIAVVGLVPLHVQDGWVDGFARDSGFRRAVDRVHERFYGTHLLQVHVELDEARAATRSAGSRSGPLLAQRNWALLANLEEAIRTRPEVGGVLGPYGQTTAVAHLWWGRNESKRAIPADPVRISDLLDTFDRGRGRARRTAVIHDNLREAVVTVFLKDANYRDTKRLMASIKRHARRHLEPAGARIRFAGDVAVSQAMIPAIVRAQLGSLLLALVGVFLAVAVLHRSWRIAALASIPPSLAVVWVLGGMGLAGVPLGVATSMVCAITLGIGVDYAIHFLERFRVEVGNSSRERCIAALQGTAPPIVGDVAAIALGFGLLCFSQVPSNARLGALVAVGLLASALATLTVLPAMLARDPQPR